MAPIIEIPFSINVHKVVNDIQHLMQDLRFANGAAKISLTHSPTETSVFVSDYTQFDTDTNTYLRDPVGQLVITPSVRGTYTDEVISEVSSIISTYGLSVGRTRVVKLPPSQAYTYHRDVDRYRFHIPLATNSRAMFVCDGIIGTMPLEGTLYRLETTCMHTAINLSDTLVRYHLVFDAY